MKITNASGQVVFEIDKATGAIVTENGQEYNPGGGGPHTHPIGDVTNLQAALDGKSDTSHTHAGGSGQLIVPIVLDPAAIAWTNMPLAVTFWNGSHRHVMKADLTSYTQCRLIVNKQATAGAAASKLILRYRTTFSTTVADYSNIGTSEVSVACNVQNAIQATAWIDLVAGAKADVFIALVGSGGDGALDPAFGSIVAQFK